MLHIIDLTIDDNDGLTRLGALLQPGDALLLTGASLAWPDTHPLLAKRSFKRLDDQLTDAALVTLLQENDPVLSHFSDQGQPRND